MPLQLLLPSSYYLYLSKKTSCYLTPWTTQQTLRTAKEQETECNAVAWESIKQLLTFPSESTSRSLGGHGGLGEAWPTPSAAIYSVGPRRPPACLSCVCELREAREQARKEGLCVSERKGKLRVKTKQRKGQSTLVLGSEREREREGGVQCAEAEGAKGKEGANEQWLSAIFSAFFSSPHSARCS